MVFSSRLARRSAGKRHLSSIALTLVVIGFLKAAPGHAQSPGKPAFDVASVRIVPSDDLQDDHEDIRSSPGALIMRHVSLKSCIQWAYSVSGFQISGPSWIASERFDIIAILAGTATADQLRLMLQSLLAERFKLTLRRTEKDQQIYILTVLKGGPKFHESKSEGSSRMRPGRFGFTAEQTSIPQLAEYLAIPMRMPVVDRTGLAGLYDLSVDLTAYAAGNSQPVDISEMVLSAVQDQLGLKLELHKGPLAFFVVEHAERIPTAN